jgi:outer membrane protein TolC
MTRKVLLSTIVLLFFLQKNIKAQTVSLDSLLEKALATDELLPLLIDSAIKYSPEVRRLSSNTAAMKENLSVNKNFIFSALSVNSSYNYGTNFASVSNQAAGGLNNFTTAQTGFYNVGVGFQLPLTHILNRKHIIKNGKAQVDMAASQTDVAILNVKQDVIRLYQDFKLSVKLLAISSKNKQNAQVNYTMVEKDFIQGQSTVVQLSSVSEINNKAIIEFETNLIRFQTLYMQLETYTNTNISTLIKQVK